MGDDETQHAVANSALKDFGHVHGPSLHAIISADDFEAIPVIPIAIAVVRWAVVPVIVANIEHAGFDESALVEIELAFLIPAISGEDPQRLVFPDGGITSHGLVIHRDSAIHAAAFDEVFENIGDVIALILETVLSAQDLPAFLLCTHSNGEKRGANGEDEQGGEEHTISTCRLHS